MVLRAIRGALGFLSRIPVGHDDAAWEAFRKTPATIPLAGYVIGALVSLPLLIPGPPPTVAFVFVVGIYVVTGINHIDGVIDLGDALVVHGNAAERRAVMKDTTVGAGGASAVALVVLGLATAGVALAALPLRAMLLVVTAEVGTKLGIVMLVCFGPASHDGLGSALTANAQPRSVLPAILIAIPAALLTWPRVIPTMATLVAAVVASLFVFRWARMNLGGVSGDVFGATNEIA
ncbi:MAG TPA: adenosylcobinamide-GDP ribazoletransferase, partial [Halococcus sp.]|nr:adenosylcobinamide-GDP ribazoletransferase [Halococcus sp.]